MFVIKRESNVGYGGGVLTLLTGNVAKTDLQAEYEHALQVAKALATEYQNAAPDHLKERIKKAILYAYDVLIMMDTPKHQIVSKLYEDFDHFYTDRHIRNIVKEADPHIDDEQEEEENGNISENNSSINPVFEQENEILIAQLEKDMDIKKAILTKLRTGAFLSKIPKDVRDELLFLLIKANKNVSQEWDGRQDVSERQFFTLIAATLAGNDKVTELYIKYVKEWHPLTGKQYTKLVHGKATMLPPIYDPKNKKEAVELGFYGTPCKCGSWRVAPTPEPTARMVLHCFACKTDFDAVTEKLPINPGIVIDSSKVC